jgi:hypothetical protein
MNFDWFTWAIWAIGFLVLLLWIIFPTKEFIKLLREKIKK